MRLFGFNTLGVEMRNVMNFFRNYLLKFGIDVQMVHTSNCKCNQKQSEISNGDSSIIVAMLNFINKYGLFNENGKLRCEFKIPGNWRGDLIARR